MSFVPLSKAYRIAPSARDAARIQAPAPLSAPTVDPDARSRRGHTDERDAEAEAERASDRDCDSVVRSPLLRALMLVLQLPTMAAGRDGAVLERALIELARALNQASNDADAAALPAASRAGDAARRRARNEEQLLVAFAELQHAAGRPSAATREALQSQLGAFLHELAQRLHLRDDAASEATQPGSLISVRA
jgi:hypothetical protein